MVSLEVDQQAVAKAIFHRRNGPGRLVPNGFKNAPVLKDLVNLLLGVGRVVFFVLFPVIDCLII